MYTCFIDLQEVYDSVDRELLSPVLTHFGVPAKTVTVKCQFPDGRRACVGTDDGEHPEIFDVTQGLRQAHVLSPLLINMCFAAAIYVVLLEYAPATTNSKSILGRTRWSEKGPL